MIEDKETARAMLDDGLVPADLLVELGNKDDDYEVMPVNKKASKMNGVIKRNIKKGKLKPISEQRRNLTRSCYWPWLLRDAGR